jgi:hypothetical protein
MDVQRREHTCTWKVERSKGSWVKKLPCETRCEGRGGGFKESSEVKKRRSEGEEGRENGVVEEERRKVRGEEKCVGVRCVLER